MCFSQIIQKLKSLIVGKQELLKNEQVAIEIYQEIGASSKNTEEVTLHIEDDITNNHYFESPKKQDSNKNQDTMDNTVELLDSAQEIDEEQNQKIDPVEDDFSRQI